jgi:hypothetical protein
VNDWPRASGLSVICKSLVSEVAGSLPRRWEITPLSIVVKGEKCAATNHDFGRGDTLQTTCGAGQAGTSTSPQVLASEPLF